MIEMINIVQTKPEIELFLKSHNIVETNNYVWECPRCNGKNHGAYFSHETPCAECKTYSHPKLSKLKEPFDKEREKSRIKEIDKLLGEYEDIEGDIELLQEQKNKINKRLDALGY